MTARLICMMISVAAAGPALADDARVRTSATVEVLDDKAQIDDVISRLRAQPERDGELRERTATLQQDRPPAPPPSATAELRRNGATEAKQQPGARRANPERPDRTERPRPRPKHK
jgi:hypothetical protein